MEDGERNDQIGTSGGSGFLNDFTPRTANNRPKSWHAAAKANQVIDLSTIDRSIKMAFVRKVYAILATQLALTVAIVAGFIYESFVVVNGVPDPKQPTEFGVWVSGSYWVFGMLFVPAIGILCFLFTLKNRYPHNYLLLFAFTVLESATLGWVCQLYYSIGYGSEILLAFGITLAIFCALTLFTMQSRIDWSFLGPAIFCMLFILIFWSMFTFWFTPLNAFVPRQLISLFGAIVFSLFIIYDTNQIMKHSGVDEYIIAAIELYLDVINLFQYLLLLLTSGGRD